MVNTREIATEYRLKHWAQVMQERNASGMSIRAYCKSISLHENVYYYWQRKLRKAAHQVMTTTEPGTAMLTEVPSGLVAPHSRTLVASSASCSRLQPDCSPMPPGWVLCETAKPEPEQGAVQIEIGKSRVTVHAGTDKELLTKVCRMLMTLC
jgi:hypothetical protein